MTLLAIANARTLWYVTRGSGVVALLLLTASVLLGIVSALRAGSERWPRFAVDRRPPQPDAALDRLRRSARRHDGRRRLRADRSQGRGGAVRVALPPALARARHGRLRPAARTGRDEPVAGSGPAQALACCPLARIRGVARRVPAFVRHRQRCALRVVSRTRLRLLDRRLARRPGACRTRGRHASWRAVPARRRRCSCRSRFSAGTAAGRCGKAGRGGPGRPVAARRATAVARVTACRRRRVGCTAEVVPLGSLRKRLGESRLRGARHGTPLNAAPRRSSRRRPHRPAGCPERRGRRDDRERRLVRAGDDARDLYRAPSSGSTAAASSPTSSTPPATICGSTFELTIDAASDARHGAVLDATTPGGEG